MKKLLYKEMVMFNKSFMILYILIFTIFSLILSTKIETMRYTGILFIIYMSFFSIAKYEDKYKGFMIINTLPVNKKDIPKSKYIFSTIILIISTIIMYGYEVILNNSLNSWLEIIIVLCVSSIYITIIYSSYYKSQFKQLQGKLLLAAILLNVICSIILAVLKKITIKKMSIIIGTITLIIIWYVGLILSIRMARNIES